MITFQPYKSGLYLPQEELSSPGTARVGFMFQDSGRTDSSYDFTSAEWTSGSNQGFFAFFAPSTTRDWDTFATQARALFQQNEGAQLGWFTEDGSVQAATLILVNRDTPGEPVAESAFSFSFRNVTFQVPVNPFGSSADITFDDDANQFAVAVPPLIQVGTSSQFNSTSESMLLPLTGAFAGTVCAAFQLGTSDLQQFEAGLAYFSPPSQSGYPLTALQYPLVRAPGGASTLLNFNVCLDVLQPLEPTRSFFQLTDTRVGSYFTSSFGHPFALDTVNDGNPEHTSRLVFANRPVQTTGDSTTYYLTPAGQFGLALDSDGLTESATPESAWLLCGVTGTEFLNVSLPANGGAPDTLYFTPGQPAYWPGQVSTARAVGEEPSYLTNAGGSVTTSWVQYLTTSGSYVSQPEQSPLYQQSDNTPSTLAGEAPASNLSVYVLDFLPLPAWTAATQARANGGPAATPAVPMVPYAGIPSDIALDPFLQIESNALNPTRKNAFSAAHVELPRAAEAGLSDGNLTYAMTPQGLLAGLTSDQTWTTLQMATSAAGTLQFLNMGSEIRRALQQNQIFAVISSTNSGKLFNFQYGQPNQMLNIADWLFELAPDGPASSDDKTPPIMILKFYHQQSIASLVADPALWSQPDIFNVSPFDASKAQAYLQTLIEEACEAVYGEGKCEDGNPQEGATPDKDSLYYNFYQAVTDPNFSGILAVNCNMQLNALPPAIRAVLGGMTKADGSSNIDAFRVHHVGVQINDTSPDSPTPTLAQSSLFGLVDYEKPKGSDSARVAGLDVDYGFEVEYLRALFVNSELRQFACQINLTINNLFDTGVNLQSDSNVRALEGGGTNVIAITGSYQAHSTSGDATSSGQGVYSFVAEGKFVYTFTGSPYLDNITLTKLQFSFLQETPVSSNGGTAISTIQSRFSIWGSIAFKELNVLDIFSFEKLSFADLGINVSYSLTIPPSPQPPTTSGLQLSFSPGDLRFDLGQSQARDSGTSLLSLLPFRLKSFLYSEKADQTLESLHYYSLSEVAGQGSVADTFNYALIFDMDLGSMGGLVGSLSAFKFSFIIGWLSGDSGGIAFGVQLPEADGKLEIKIEGIFTLSIEQFTLKYATAADGNGALDDQQLLVVGLHNCYLEILGTRLPPGEAMIDFALFAPTDNADRIGWMAAYNNTGGGEASNLLTDGGNGENGDDGGVFELLYLGGGQRVGPDPSKPPTTFKDFLSFMTDDFWKAFEAGKYDEVYHPDSKWLVIADFKLLKIIEVGFIFYDATPFYSLMLNVENLFNFEITYTKISDTIGLFYANLTLPDAVRTFQVGAASLTLPGIGVSVYTNGNWKLDVGFPEGDDWSRSFQVQAMAGPVPVTGAGGFYIASLSSATSKIFKGNYPSILAFGFAARLGVGKDFTSGPLKAGISVTFFGIIEGAVGYLVSGSTEIFTEPDALSLKGQFGIIGQIYGSVDFKIISASVNVTLQGSIGIELLLEQGVGGSILLYIEASVTLSLRLSINLGFFSIHISLSFKASIRFQWELTRGSSTTTLLLAARSRAALDVGPVTLCPGLPTTVPLWFLPELTVVFPNDTDAGVPWFVCSLGVEYNPTPPSSYPYDQFKPFEAITAQFVTWALIHASGLTGCSATVERDALEALDRNPDALVGWILYGDLIAQLGQFSVQMTVPTSSSATTVSAAVFPMFPFLQLQTQGRLDGSGKPDDLNYQFSSHNSVDDAYVQLIESYFNQLFVNQGVSESPPTVADGSTPLVQEIFLDYFNGLIRGAVNQLLQWMYDSNTTSAALDQVIQGAAGAGYLARLAGQTSSWFRGGARVPSEGLQVPDGAAPSEETYPLYAALWQEFPVGQLSPVSHPNGVTAQYAVTLAKPTSTNDPYPWLTTSVQWQLTDAILGPYQNVKPGDVSLPSTPTQLPFTNTGPQAFAFENAIAWAQPGGGQASLRPFPANLQGLQGSISGAISVLVESRATGAPYLPGSTPLPPNDFTWATAVHLTIKQVPAGTAGSYLPDVYSLSGASQQDQALLELLLRELENGSNPIASIQVLYQSGAGAAGLNSATVNSRDVFVLRTNTTTVSQPPATLNMNLLFTAQAAPPQVAVGAQIDEAHDFLQIVQQAAVTNAPGYYLRYQDAAGNHLPPDLFSAGPAQVTLLVTYSHDGSKNTPQSLASVRPFYNAICLSNAQAGLLYYAETTDPALETQHSAVAAGSVGVELTRDGSSMVRQPSTSMAAANGLEAGRGHTRAELVEALHAAGVRDETELYKMLAAAGDGSAQLNALYSLITYQVEKSAGFIQSNLSAPIQPQQPDDAGDDDGPFNYQVFVPLYNLADANQSLNGAPPNRYASINDPFSLDFFLNDAFGNQLPTQLNFGGTNLYFDPILPVDRWQGVAASYDFVAGSKPQASTLTVYLTPSAQLFGQISTDQAAAALQLYYTIRDQITASGVSLYIESNLALQSDGTMVQVELASGQSGAVVKMVGAIVTYLQQASSGSTPAFNVPPVPLSVTVSGTGTLPPVFQVAVLLGIQRDPKLISPLLKDHAGNITFPSAQNIASAVPSTVGSAPDDSSAPVDINAFASNFVRAFPALALSVGLNGAQEPQQSSTGQARARLKAQGAPSDGTGSAQPGPQSLWAVQRVLLDITIGGGNTSPRYLSPTPLDNTLNTQLIPLPTLSSPLPSLPPQQLFTDVNLDQLNRAFFQTVDNLLSPASAARMFEQARDAYTTVALGRESLAQKYAAFEVDWLFPDGSPFTGSDDDRTAAREVFEQQMRAALMTAYSVDTLVQFPVSWNSAVPSAADDMIALFGQVQPAGGIPANSNFSLSTAQVMASSSGPSRLTFLYGTSAVQDEAQVSLDLQFNLTHVEYFLEPASQTPSDEARPSIWLQLVNPFPNGLPHIGTGETVIPLVLRQYPTPPTLVSQSATGGSGTMAQSANSPNPLIAAAAWYYVYTYQAQLTAHDQLVNAVTYNTNLSASSGQGDQMMLADNATYTLFEALARFTAAYAVLQPILLNLSDPNWAAAATAFSSLVTDVVQNKDWNPSALSAFAAGLVQVTDNYVVTDLPQDSQRLITLTWGQSQGQSSWPNATLSVQALDPTMQPYPGQQQQAITNGITDIYTPNPPLVDDWAVHQIMVDKLNVLLAENALAGVQIERNLIEMNGSVSRSEFIYMTPLVRPSQPATPFVDNDTAIDVTQLPNQGSGAGCSSSSPANLCQRIYTMMYDLLADPNHVAGLQAAMGSVGQDDSVTRRVKVACSFQYPVAAGTDGGIVSPLVPVVLARSFVVDASQPEQLSDFAQLFASAITEWSQSNGVVFGSTPQPQGGQLIFDITLYAQLSSLNTPVLRLRNLQLKLADIDPV